MEGDGAFSFGAWKIKTLAVPAFFRKICLIKKKRSARLAWNSCEYLIKISREEGS
jgi:hypothetical protein